MFNYEDSESDISNTPEEFMELTKNVSLNLLPDTSKRKYERKYDQFTSWCVSKKIEEMSENVLLAYFDENSKVMKSPTLWSTFSMLKATILVKHNINIGSYKKLIAFLKKQSIGYKPQQSQTLSKDEVETFLKTAPDEIYLMKKVILIFGIAGACSRDELAKMEVDCVEDEGSMLIVKILESKNKKSRTFTITNDNGHDINYLDIYRKYIRLRPIDLSTGRLFLKYHKGVCIKQPVGINSIGKVPTNVAAFLNLPNPEMYTGHCFRRTSANLLVEAGVDLLQLKRHGGWKSSTVAEGYIDSSISRQVSTEEVSPDEVSTEQVSTEQVSNDSESDLSNTPEDFLELGLPITENVSLNLLPGRSEKQYERKYDLFTSWCVSKKVKKISENVLLAYFAENSKVMKSSTLWSTYSMLKATILVKHDINIGSYKKLIAFLKKQSIGYKPQKPKTLSKDEVETFLKTAPDEIYLMKKVILIFGLAGACSRDELAKLKVDCIEDKGSMLIVKILESKNNKSRIFTITNDNGHDVNYLDIYRKYLKLRPIDLSSGRLFLKYHKGVCIKQPVGVNTIAKVPANVAAFLNLPNPKMYTGHCFRRTSASLFVEEGGEVLQLKRHRGWKSSMVTERYIDSSISRQVSTEEVLPEELSTEQVSNDSDSDYMPEDFLEVDLPVTENVSDGYIDSSINGEGSSTQLILGQLTPPTTASPPEITIENQFQKNIEVSSASGIVVRNCENCTFNITIISNK